MTAPRLAVEGVYGVAASFGGPLIDDILVTGPQLIADQHMTEAESTMTAQYSCPYIVGATLAYGPRRYDAYGEEFLTDERIRRIAGKVRFEVDPELEKAYYPEHFATGVRLRFRDGGTRSAVVVDSVGTARHPMSTEQIVAKGDGLASRDGRRVGERLSAALWNDGHGGHALAEALISL
ncbi:MmgE/PrpD family protein [Streptomyces sp. LaPpAH-108]|uniref:MmgE/PrpD family protein n=1 Tax=Streptomyces sp. LaPpAH-108 TaxID=1155714 RepID=UPI000380BFE4|nr:MmgE/PrpD family protein [Streptomyces sp. LaPpAH-108]